MGGEALTKRVDRNVSELASSLDWVHGIEDREVPSSCAAVVDDYTIP